MDKLEILLLVAIGSMGILLIILLHKITILKKQTDDIIEEVKAYVAFVTADEEEKSNASKQGYMVKKDVGQVMSGNTKYPGKTNKEEMENHIIQAVLGEYFP